MSQQEPAPALWIKLVAGVFFILALVAGIALSRWLIAEPIGVDTKVPLAEKTTPPSAQLQLDALHPGFRHGRVDGAMVSMDDFAGEVVLVNFWAPWCAPCREEMPMLQQLSSELQGKSFTVVGIALDDVARVRDFVDQIGIDYPILVGGPDVLESNKRWGNPTGALPYSVLVDREGIVRWTFLGPLKAPELRAQIDPLL
ncbi:MAG: TlpA family protein disulfide reductase [Xanthomonadales bacterium]|jgi:thiol-disulfide isomerase/thioredoxin|nr:TlpA family protein disulfide reductase [Xanthomonadales bacterium]